MIFRTAVRLASHKRGLKELFPEGMFENHVTEKNSFKGAISNSYFIT